MIPAPLRPSPSDEFRDRVSEVAGADLYQAHKIASCLMSEDAPGATVRARFDNLPGDLRDFENLAEALTRRIGSVMQGEEEGTDDDWRRFNYYADKIESAVSKAVDVLRWRTAATVSAGANNPCGKVG